MSEKVLGFKEKEFFQAIKWLDKEIKKDDGLKVVLRKETLETMKKELEIILEDGIPVITEEWLKKQIKKRPCKSCDWSDDLLCVVKKEVKKEC